VTRTWLPAVLIAMVPLVNARAEPAPPQAPGEGTASPTGAEPPVGLPGARIVAGQAPVVGGNAAAARERAVDEAIRQAVDGALLELADAPTRAAEAKAIRAIEARARSFVPSYRTLDESEGNGVYSVHLEAQVDEAALRQTIDRWSLPAPAPSSMGTALGVLIEAADADPTSAALGARLAGALSALGVRARAGGQGATTLTAAMPAAAAAGLPAAALVAAATADDGAVRGTSNVAAGCHGVARLLTVPAGAPIAERSANARGFAGTMVGAREDCLARLGAALAPALFSSLSSRAGSRGGDLRALSVDADVVEPAAVAALVASLREIGAVSAAELRRVGGGRAQIQLRTRSPAATVAAALARDAAASLTISDIRPDGDTIHVRARLRVPVGAGAP
jgi:hypothetical protein